MKKNQKYINFCPKSLQRVILAFIFGNFDSENTVDFPVYASLTYASLMKLSYLCGNFPIPSIAYNGRVDCIEFGRRETRSWSIFYWLEMTNSHAFKTFFALFVQVIIFWRQILKVS
jgi:hypothetical protein